MTEEIERVKRYGFLTAAELERSKKVTQARERLHNNRDKTESGNYVNEYVNHFATGSCTRYCQRI